MNKNKPDIKLPPGRFELILNIRLFEVELKFYLAFLLIILVGFWPVSTGIFSLKNDEIIYFLPYRFNIVENIRNGHLPLWSPYIYMGFPISGDIQSGAWNPLVWFLALFGRYNLATLHAELLIYIYVAVIGMFKLMRTLQFNNLVCFTIAVSYAFSGFIIDSGQFICWISNACFLPYVYMFFIRLLGRPDLVVSAKFAIANFCLLIVAGYPFFFIANVYFLTIAFFIFAIAAIRNHENKKIIRVFMHLSLSVLLITLLSTAPLLCFINLMPYYSRGTNLPLNAALFNSYSFFSSISFLFPFSITRHHVSFANNNVLSRNLYIGIILLPFAVTGIFFKRNLQWNTVLTFVIISFVLSMGEALPFRRWAYLYLPLMDTFRHPSNFRLFITVGLLAFAGKGLQELFMSPANIEHVPLKLFYSLLLLILIIGIYFLPLKENNPFTNVSFSPIGLKKILNNISFNQSVTLSLVVQAPFLLLAIFFSKRRRYGLVCLLSLLNILVLAQPQLLSSTVAKNSVSEINTFIRNQPEGFPAPSSNEPVYVADENKIFIYEYREPIKYFFNKKISVNTFINNPTILKTYGNFINDGYLLTALKHAPFLFIANRIAQDINSSSWLPSITPVAQSTPDNRASLISFQPNEFKLSVNTVDSCMLVILQNNFPGWTARIDHKLLPIQTVNDTFMGLKIPAGSHELDIKYSPSWFLPGMIVSAAGLLVMVFILMSSYIVGWFPKK